MNPFRTFTFFVLTPFFMGATGSSFGQDAPPKAVEGFLSQHCYDCHDDAVNKGGLNLLDLDFQPNDHANFEKWVRIFDRVETGEMPPKKKPRPEAEKKEVFLTSLEKPLIDSDLAEKKERGRVNVRRLTRQEYENTLHDLLGIDLPLAELLPDDPATHGFETVSSGQQFSHHNLGRYLEVADLALNTAFERATRQADEKFSKLITPEMLSKKSGGNYRGPELRDGRSISYPIRQQYYGRLPMATVPKDGWYRITLKNVQAVNPKTGVVWGTLRSGACASNAPILYPIGLVEATPTKRDLIFEAWIRGGHMLELKPNDATLKNAPTGATGGNTSYKGRDLVKQGFAGIANDGIKIERFYPNSERWELRRNLFPGITKEDAAKLKSKEEQKEIFEQTIRNFANEAFRRPVTKEQIAPYIGLAMSAMEKPDCPPREALRKAYRAILCSPRFLTLVENPGRLDDHALASRLSYTLWNSMPDKKLRTFADEGKLHETEHFHAEVKRMLDHKKGERFFVSFTDQWLDLKNIEDTSPDLRMFRTFDAVVQDSMVAETRAFFREMVLKNMSITNVIDSDFMMANERLARFYQMDKLAVKPGEGMQKVSLGKYERGGLVTQGAILKVTANGTTTSPVVRGVYVGERLLGLEIPPPPANVPAVEPDIRGAVSIRDQLEKHKNSESCAGCHVNIDPGGFALENFDPVGLWRTKYGPKKTSANVDPSGITPDGKEFPDVFGWKEIYKKRPRQLTEAFTKQFLTYATGAPVRFSDRDAVENIVAAAGDKGYKMRSIFHAALGSEVFRTK